MNSQLFFDVRSSRTNLQMFSLVAILLLSALALAQDDSVADPSRQPTWGTSESPTAGTVAFETALAPITNRITFQSAQFGSGGVGLRNRGTGAISVSGVLAPVKAAYIYWAVITSGAALAPDKTIKLQRLSPAPASAVDTPLAGFAQGSRSSSPVTRSS